MKKSYWIILIALALISVAGASFNNFLVTFMEHILINFGITSQLLLHSLIFIIFLIILVSLGFAFKPLLKRIIKR